MLNTENGYEYLRGYATNRRQVHHTDKVRRAAWRIVCAGGYFAAGFIATIGHSDNWNRIDPGSKHPFLVKDEGAAGQLALLSDFFTALPFWRMQPQLAMVRGDALGLAAPGEAYAVYAPHGGQFMLDLGTPAKALAGRWFNPRQGGFGKPFAVAGGRMELQPPDSEDWALLIQASD